MKNILTGILAFQMCATTFAATIGNIDISTNADSDAIVTADLKSKGVSLGGERQWSLSGDVFKLVSAGSGKKHCFFKTRYHHYHQQPWPLSQRSVLYALSGL